MLKPIVVRRTSMFKLRLVRQQETTSGSGKRDVKFITFQLRGYEERGIDRNDEFRLYDRFNLEKSYTGLKVMAKQTILEFTAQKPNADCNYYRVHDMKAELVWLKENG